MSDYTCLAIAYLNVGITREKLRRWTEAAMAYRQGFEVSSRCLGFRHPLTKALGENCGADWQAQPLPGLRPNLPEGARKAAVMPGVAGALVARTLVKGPMLEQYVMPPLQSWPPKSTTAEERRWYSLGKKKKDTERESAVDDAADSRLPAVDSRRTVHDARAPEQKRSTQTREVVGNGTRDFTPLSPKASSPDETAEDVQDDQEPEQYDEASEQYFQHQHQHQHEQHHQHLQHQHHQHHQQHMQHQQQQHHQHHQHPLQPPEPRNETPQSWTRQSTPTPKGVHPWEESMELPPQMPSRLPEPVAESPVDTIPPLVFIKKRPAATKKIEPPPIRLAQPKRRVYHFRVEEEPQPTVKEKIALRKIQGHWKEKYKEKVEEHHHEAVHKKVVIKLQAYFRMKLCRNGYLSYRARVIQRSWRAHRSWQFRKALMGKSALTATQSAR